MYVRCRPAWCASRSWDIAGTSASRRPRTRSPTSRATARACSAPRRLPCTPRLQGTCTLNVDSIDIADERAEPSSLRLERPHPSRPIFERQVPMYGGPGSGLGALLLTILALLRSLFSRLRMLCGWL